MNPRMFTFTVQRPGGDSFTFLGQGVRVKEAFDDGIKNCADGHGIGITHRDGTRSNSTLSVFEAEKVEAVEL